MNVFLDTNVLVSAFATRGLCADLLEIVLLEHDLAIGPQVLRELDRVLRTKFKLPRAEAKAIVEFISGEAARIVDRVSPASAALEPDDAVVLGEALAAQAEVLVTGDSALLDLGAFQTVRIVSPRQFWEMLHSPARAGGAG